MGSEMCIRDRPINVYLLNKSGTESDKSVEATMVDMWLAWLVGLKGQSPANWNTLRPNLRPDWPNGSHRIPSWAWKRRRFQARKCQNWMGIRVFKVSAGKVAEERSMVTSLIVHVGSKLAPKSNPHLAGRF